jgi:hypothetical protein
MSYQDNVRAAAAALTRGEDANWELARLTFESTRSRGEFDKPTMETWCSDVRAASGRRFGVSTGEKYKIVWRRYGDPSLREGLSWNEAYIACFEGGSPDAFKERLAPTNFNLGIEHGTVEAKRAAFSSLARDPDVITDHATSAEVFSQIALDNPAAVQEAWKHTETNAALSEARWQAHQEQIVQPAREKRAIFEPTDTTLDRTSFFYDIQKKVDQWARELDSIRDFLANAEDVNLVTRKATRSSFELLIHAAEQCRDTLPSSRAAKDDVVESTPHRRRGVLAG